MGKCVPLIDGLHGLLVIHVDCWDNAWRGEHVAQCSTAASTDRSQGGDAPAAMEKRGRYRPTNATGQPMSYPKCVITYRKPAGCLWVLEPDSASTRASSWPSTCRGVALFAPPDLIPHRVADCRNHHSQLAGCLFGCLLCL